MQKFHELFSVKFLFEVSIKISRILDNKREGFPSVFPMQSSSSSLACTTTVRSATHSQQHSGRFWATQRVNGGALPAADDPQRLEAVICRGIRSDAPYSNVC